LFELLKGVEFLPLHGFSGVEELCGVGNDASVEYGFHPYVLGVIGETAWRPSASDCSGRGVNGFLELFRLIIDLDSLSPGPVESLRGNASGLGSSR
jgi:hypothetical protein